MIGQRKLKNAVVLAAVIVCGMVWYASPTFSNDSNEYIADKVTQHIASEGPKNNSKTQITNLQITTNRVKIPSQPKIIGLLVNSSSCRVPDYDPWDESIADVIKAEEPFGGCHRDYPVTMQQKGNELVMITKKAAKDQCKIECCYRSVSRENEGHSDNDYKFGTENVCFGGQRSLKINEEFLHVKCFCTKSNVTVYEDFRAFIVSKPKPTLLFDKDIKRDGKLNVYMIGLDSVSTLNFKRFWPDTEKLLADDFAAIPMLGLNKIGVNTFPNMLACLAGIRMDQLNQSLRGDPFDNITLAWKLFSKLGYVTMFNEDSPEIATFNYLKKGFFITPTDYYLRPMFRAIQGSKFVRSEQTLCINQREQIDLQLQWLEDFMAQPDVAPQFALLFSSALSHKGPLTYVKPMQSRLNQFLQRYRSSARYNSSILFFFSDHGMRFGPIMRHELGGYESRLPFFYVVLPPWYAARHPHRVASLRANSARLTTFFDVHATLRDLLRDAGAAESDLLPLPTPGVSLFQPVPSERTCDAAGIAPNWCVCRARRPLPPDDAVIWRAAAAAMRHINTELLREVRALCAELRLLRVTAAFHLMSEAGGKVKDTKYQREAFDEYALQLVTEPGRAEFEATVRCWRGLPPTPANSSRPQVASPGTGERQARCQPDHPMVVVDVSRLNLYRGQSDCLLDRFNERRFCFCKDLL